MSLLVVGSVALDSVETPFGRKEDVLGGSATYFSTSASFFTPARVVAVVGEDFPEAHLNFLRGRGIDLEGLTRESGRTFRWSGRYGYELNEAQTLDTQLNVFQSFSPKLPAAYQDTPYVFLGNIHPELQSQVLDQVRAPKLVAADTMNFWIKGSRAALLNTLKRVNLLFVNDAEARQLAGEHNVVKAARAILSMGPSAWSSSAVSTARSSSTTTTSSPARPSPWPRSSTPPGRGTPSLAASWARWPRPPRTPSTGRCSAAPW